MGHLPWGISALLGRALLLSLGLLAGADATAVAQAPALHLRRVEIADPAGFQSSVAAFALLAPAGWSVRGGIAWQTAPCPLHMIVTHAAVESPDGSYALEFFPTQTWTWSTDQLANEVAQRMAAAGTACPARPAMNAIDALRQIYLPAFRPGAEVLEARGDAALAAELFRARQGEVGLYGAQAQLWSDAARLRLRTGGSEEWLVGGLTVMAHPVPSASLAMQGAIGSATALDSVMSVSFAFRAPAGQLDASEPVLSAMLRSVRINPAWQMAAGKVLIAVAQAQLKGAVDRANIWRDAMQEIGEARMQSWWRTQESQDRTALAFSQSLRGVQSYVEPTGGSVELPAGYASAWSNGLGDYVLSSSPGYTPAAMMPGQWTEIQPQR